MREHDFHPQRLFRILHRFSLLLLVVLLHTSCSHDEQSMESLNDPQARIAFLENNVRRLNEEIALKSERLAIHDATMPGGLAMGEREEQLDQRESRVSASESQVDAAYAELQALREEMEREERALNLARQRFVEDKEELLIRIGNAEQMTERYEEVVQEKNSALANERNANLRAGEAMKYIAVVCGLCFLSMLLTFAYAGRLRTERKRLDAVIHTTQLTSSSDVEALLSSRRLGRIASKGPADC